MTSKILNEIIALDDSDLIEDEFSVIDKICEKYNVSIVFNSSWHQDGKWQRIYIDFKSIEIEINVSMLRSGNYHEGYYDYSIDKIIVNEK